MKNQERVRLSALIPFVFSIVYVSCKSVGEVNYKVISNANAGKGPPVLNEGNSSTVVAYPRENVELNCPIISSPPFFYEWYKENPSGHTQDSITVGWERFKPSNQGRLKIRSVTHDDSGAYTCKAVNGFGFTSYTIHLAVTGDDPFKDNLLKPSTNKRSNVNASFFSPEIVRDHLPKERTTRIVKGSNLFLKCEAKGNPKPNITWIKGETKLAASRENVLTLKLMNLTKSNNGKYRCESVNIFGKSVYEVSLEVTGSWQGKTEILELNPSNLTLFPGGSGNITCMARFESESYPTWPWFVWVKKVENVSKVHNATEGDKVFLHEGVYYKVLRRSDVKEKAKHVYTTELILTNVSSSDAGIYKCAVAGLNGVDHSEAHVFVQADPSQVAREVMKKQKASTVQWAVLWVFAFLILAVMMVFCFIRLYGCHGPLKNPAIPKKAQVLKKSPETLSTTLTHQNEVFIPLMNNSTSSRQATVTESHDTSVNSNSGATDSEVSRNRNRSKGHHPYRSRSRPSRHSRNYDHSFHTIHSRNRASSCEYSLPLHSRYFPPNSTSELNIYEDARIHHHHHHHQPHLHYHSRHSKISYPNPNNLIQK